MRYRRHTSCVLVLQVVYQAGRGFGEARRCWRSGVYLVPSPASLRGSWPLADLGKRRKYSDDGGAGPGGNYWHATVACFIRVLADYGFPHALMLLIALTVLTVASRKAREDQVQQSKHVGHERRTSTAEVPSTLIHEEVFRQVVWRICMSLSISASLEKSLFCRVVRGWGLRGLFKVYSLSLAPTSA